MERLIEPTPQTPGPPQAPMMEMQERVARLAKTHLADSYMCLSKTKKPGGNSVGCSKDQSAAADRLIAALGQSPEPLHAFVLCRRDQSKEPQLCHSNLVKELDKAIGIVKPSNVFELPLNDPSVLAEIDKERFLANAQSLAYSLAALDLLAGKSLDRKYPLTDKAIVGGIADGANRATRYIQTRTWSRSSERPSTAIVLSGGGSGGAFSAGVIWRLLSILKKCRLDQSCPDSRIDLAAGTSTGALIATLIAKAENEGLETAADNALDLLIDSYTCSTNSKLYCVDNRWTWHLASDLKGIVRFDGIADKLKKHVLQSQGLSEERTERVVVSVDFESGDIYGQSSQDPEDDGQPEEKLNAIMASIVVPVFAQPIDSIALKGGKQPGTFLDGGVRSGVPLLEAVRRGAERVLIVNAGGIEPGHSTTPNNAIKILLRTVDLMSGQILPGELQQGELEALARRWTEYDVCIRRIDSTKDQEAKKNDFCERTGFFHRAKIVAQAAQPTFIAPGHFRQVASSWRTAWISRPAVDIALESYDFDPSKMRTLFTVGAGTFQDRCHELLDLLDINIKKPASDPCKESREAVEEAAKAAYEHDGHSLDACGQQGARTLRSCD